MQRSTFPNFFVTAVLLAAVCACSFIHDDSPVAKVGRKTLYKSEVIKFIPPGLSEEDSLSLASQYINAWAAELIINKIATEQLSKKEKDVTAEIEDYRNSLLKYRYEQHYIQERLNTDVSMADIVARFEKDSTGYRLTSPILRLRYVKIPSAFPFKEDVMERMASEEDADRVFLDSLSRTVIGRYTDFDGQWVDLVTLSRELGMDRSIIEAAFKSRKKPYLDLVDAQNMNHIIYILESVDAGNIPPIEYCAGEISDEIISIRKYELSYNLERTLLDDALKSGEFVIFEDKQKEEKQDE